MDVFIRHLRNVRLGLFISRSPPKMSLLPVVGTDSKDMDGRVEGGRHGLGSL